MKEKLRKKEGKKEREKRKIRQESKKKKTGKTVKKKVKMKVRKEGRKEGNQAQLIGAKVHQVSFANTKISHCYWWEMSIRSNPGYSPRFMLAFLPPSKAALGLPPIIKRVESFEAYQLKTILISFIYFISNNYIHIYRCECLIPGL